MTADARPTRVYVVADGGMAARIEAMLRRDPSLRVVVQPVGALTGLEPGGDTTVVVLALPASAVARHLDELRNRPRPPAVILMAATPAAAWTARARRSGVRAVLPHDVTADELVAAIAAVRAGLLVLHPDAVGRAPAATLAPGEPSTLTAREMEILEMMAEGMNNRAIASRLKISRHTVKFHVAAILTKLAAHSRTEAVTLGVRQGLLSL